MKQKFIIIGQYSIQTEQITNIEISQIDEKRCLHITYLEFCSHYHMYNDKKYAYIYEKDIDCTLEEKLEEITNILNGGVKPVLSAEKRLEKVMKLYEKGIITQQEYQQKRKQLLEEL